MMPRWIDLRVIYLLVCFLLAPVAQLLADDAPRPNIIVILSDDLAQGDLGCYGQKLIKTPNIDRLAAQGMRFTQAYCGTSVCAPSRTSLITGLHSGHSPVRGNRELPASQSKYGAGQLPLPESTITIAQVLKSAGYATACTGKWGMGQFDTTGSPLKKGFDHFYGYNGQVQAHNYFPPDLFNDDQLIEFPENKAGQKKVYSPDVIGKDTLDWVRKNSAHPFFLFWATTLPHGEYEINDLGEYANRGDWTARQKTYAAMVTRLDSDVGQLMNLLKELKIDDKTIVILAGDNGSSFSPDSPIGKLFDQSMGGKLRDYKRSLYEGGLRQAAMVRWPGVVPAGVVRDEPWAFWDILPTAADLAGAKLRENDHTDGLSLVSYFKGGAAPKRDYFYFELHEGKPIQAIRFGQWKAVKNGPSAKVELYDLSKDEAEAHDLSADHPQEVARAAQLMKEARTDDPHWPMNEPKPNRNSPNNQPKNPTPPAAP